ncbi:MAG TPA: MarR family transcriptional regulator [Limnochordales bacterium]
MSISRSLELLANFLQGRGMSGSAPEEYGVTHAQFVLLRHLLWNPGSSLGQVADCLGISRPAATQAVDRLVQRGLVRRRADTGDRRRLRLALTPRGEALVRQLAHMRERQLEAIVARMPPEERAALARGVDAFLVAALDEPSRVQAACLHCGADHEEDCPVNLASLRLTGRPVVPAQGLQVETLHGETRRGETPHGVPHGIMPQSGTPDAETPRAETSRARTPREGRPRVKRRGTRPQWETPPAEVQRV